MPRGTVVSTVFFLRRTLLVRFTKNDGAMNAHLRRNGPRRPSTTRKRKKIHCRDGSATWHCRFDSVLPATYLARAIYEERRCDEHPPAQKRTPAPLSYKGTEKDSLPRRQCHVALSFRQCSSLRRTLLVRFTKNDGAMSTHLRGNGPRRPCTTRKRKNIHCRDGSATWHCRPDSVLPRDVPCSCDLRGTTVR